MAGVYGNTSNIVDGQDIDAADVKVPIDAIDDAIVGFRDGTNQFNQIRTATASTVTIAAGVITITNTLVYVDTEGAASTDNLDTINGGAVGDILILYAANSARHVVVRSGVGNIQMFGGNVTLNHNTHALVLQFDGANWRAVATPGGREAVHVFNNANISIANNSETIVTFNSESFDTNTLHSTSVNTDRLTCASAGIYLIGANIRWGALATGIRALVIRASGLADPIARVQVDDAFNNEEQSVSVLYNAVAGEYLTMSVYHTQGGSLNLLVANNYSPRFWMTKLF